MSSVLPAYGDAVVSLIMDNPFYAHVVSEMQPVLSTRVPLAAVELGAPFKLHLNREAFPALPLKQRVGVLIHEVLHVVMEHFLRQDSRDRDLWNVATDLAVNELIDSHLLPPNCLTVPSVSQQLGVGMPRRAAAEVYYDVLEKHTVKVTVTVTFGGSNSRDGQENQDGGATVTVTLQRGDRRATYSPSGDHGLSGSSLDPATRELVREVARQMVERASQACGTVPAGLEAYLKALQERTVNWRRVLARFLQGRGRMLALPTYTREHRRFPDFPGRRKRVGMEALVVIDTSGSMSDRTLAEVLGQLLQIRKVSGTRIWVTWGDTRKEGGPVPIEKVGRSVRLKGRGGTDLCWPFELARRMRVPVVVYFTDGYGPAPEEPPPHRVLWVVTEGGTRPAPYGYELRLQKPKAGR